MRPDNRVLDRVMHWLYPDRPYHRDPSSTEPCPREAWRKRVLLNFPTTRKGVVRYRSAALADDDMQEMEAEAFRSARARQSSWRRWLPTRFWK